MRLVERMAEEQLDDLMELLLSQQLQVMKSIIHLGYHYAFV